MTEDPTIGRQHGGFQLPSAQDQAGRAYEEALEHETVADVDFESHELHAAGRKCVRCGRVIQPGEDVRRTASGAYEHELCPVPLDQQADATDG
jgi:hypothetical protein